MTDGSALRLENFLPYRLSIVSNLLSDRVATAYETLFGLRIPEWRLVAVIAEAGDEGITQQAIGTRTRMDKVTVSRAAIALIDRRLVTRRAHPVDRRSHLLHLTPAGRTLHAEVAPKALEIEAQVFAGFDRQELDRFRATLDRIEARLLDAGPD